MRTWHPKVIACFPLCLLIASSGCNRPLDLLVRVRLSRGGKPLPDESVRLAAEAIWYDASYLPRLSPPDAVSDSVAFPPMRGGLIRQSFRGSFDAKTDARGRFTLERKQWNPPSYRPALMAVRLSASVGAKSTECRLLVIPTAIEVGDPISRLARLITGDTQNAGPVYAEADCDLNEPTKAPIHFVMDSIIERYLTLDEVDYQKNGGTEISGRASKPDFFAPKDESLLTINPSGAPGAR